MTLHMPRRHVWVNLRGTKGEQGNKLEARMKDKEDHPSFGKLEKIGEKERRRK